MESPFTWGWHLLTSASRRPWALSAAGSVFLLMLWTIVSVPYLFENQTVRWVALVYFAMLSVALWAAEKPLLRDTTLAQGWGWFAVGFLGVFFLTQAVLGTTSYEGSFIGLVLMQSMLVGLSENAMFFGALPQYLTPGITGKVSDSMMLASAGVFSLFHGWAYDWNTISMVVAFCFGIAMLWIIYAVKSKTGSFGAGLLCSAGVHSAYNVAVYMAMPLTTVTWGDAGMTLMSQVWGAVV